MLQALFVALANPNTGTESLDEVRNSILAATITEIEVHFVVKIAIDTRYENFYASLVQIDLIRQVTQLYFGMSLNNVENWRLIFKNELAV